MGNDNVLDISSVKLGEKLFAQFSTADSMSAGASGLCGGVLSHASSKYWAYAGCAANPPNALPTKNVLRSIRASILFWSMDRQLTWISVQ